MWNPWLQLKIIINNSATDYKTRLQTDKKQFAPVYKANSVITMPDPVTITYNKYTADYIQQYTTIHMQNVVKHPIYLWIQLPFLV